jgi:hypothetical protein
MRVMMHGGGQGFESLRSTPEVQVNRVLRALRETPKARLQPPRDPSPCVQVHADGSGWDSAGSNRTTPSDVGTRSLAYPMPQP